MPKFKVTAEDLEQIYAMKKQGIAHKEIAEKIDISSMAVYRWLKWGSVEVAKTKLPNSSVEIKAAHQLPHKPGCFYDAARGLMPRAPMGWHGCPCTYRPI